MKKLSPLEKKRLIQVSIWMVWGRWIYIGGLAFVGIVSKIVGGVNINFPAGLIIAISINAAVLNFFYLWFFKRGEKRSDFSLRLMALFFLLVDMLLLTFVIHYAGSIESTSFLYYIFVIVASSFIYGMGGTFIFAVLSSLALTFLVLGEHIGLFVHLQRYYFPLPLFRNSTATLMIIINVVVSFFVTGFFTGFLANLIRKEERGLISEKEKTASILQSLDDGILVLNKKGDIVHFNERLKEILKINSFEKNNTDSRADDFKILLEYIFSTADMKNLQKGDSPVFRDFILDIDGERFLKIISLPLKEPDGITGIIRIIRDETKEKILDKMKTDFITVAAHKLRTPLSATKWVFETLKSGELAPFSKEQQDNIKMGYESNERMIRLVNDFLNAARLTGGDLKYDFKRRNLKEFLKEVAWCFMVRANAKGIKFTADFHIANPKVLFDADQLRAAVEGLLENAFIYTKKGGKIFFSANQEADEKEVLIKVEDTGVGIPANQQEMIFNKFFRAANAMHIETEGSGLGLFLAKEIVNRHGGDIWFESEENKGSSFYIKLPING